MRKIIIALAALIAATPAAAQCVWQWDCTNGQFRQVPICQSRYDFVPFKPLERAPVPPPTVRPIQLPTLPPLGTRNCQQRYICTDGQCAWRQVCQ